MKLKLLLSFSLFLFAIPIFAFKYTYEGVTLNYEILKSGDRCQVSTNPTSLSGHIAIPSTVEYDGTEYRVDIIGEDAFRNCWGITSVSLPYTISEIGDFSFYHCTGLSEIEIPESVTKIGEWAFESCVNLSSVSLPSTVELIGQSAFHKCVKLTSVELPSSMQALTDAFSECTGLTSITIPQSVTLICLGALSGCTNLKSVSIPNSVNQIAAAAFNRCTSLTSITIPESVKILGHGAFSNCTNLVSVYIPNSITTFGGNEFENCPSITEVNYNTIAPKGSLYNNFDYSVYQNATLYVAIGGLTKAKQTDPWYRFANIQEKDFSEQTMTTEKPQVIVKLPGGNLHLAEEHAGTIVRLTADDGFVLHSASLDDEDVSHLVGEQGHFTVPTVDKPTVLNVVFKQTEKQETAINAVSLDDEVRVSVHGKRVCISGKSADTAVRAYDLRGVLIEETTDSEFYLDFSGVVILRVGADTFKFAI